MAYDAHGFRARAVHTDRPTLATAAYMDWSAELRASTSFAMAARSCCTGATLLRFSIFPRTLTGCPSCQAFFRRCESQRVWPRIALVVRREGAGSSSRGSGPLPDGMCWWRPVYLRSWHGLELVPAANAFQLRKCVRPRPASRLTMWRRATSIDWWRCWQTSRSGAARVWLQPMIFGKCGGHGNEASGAGGSQHMSPWQGGRQRSATLWPGQGAHYGFGWALSRQASRTSILLAQPVDSPLCSCATYATASCALIAPGHAELAALSRLALALLGLVLPSQTSVQTMDKDGLGGSGGRGAPSSVRSGGSVASCPWRPPGRGLCLCFLQSGKGDSRCRSRSGRGLAAGSGTLGRGGQPGIGPRSRVGWAAGQPSFSPSSAQAV